MEDEISLQEIITRLWRRRGIIISFVLLAVLGVGAWSLLQLGFSVKDIVYFISLKGIEKGQYPGGAAFSPNDLRSAEVLRSAIEAAGLDVEQAQAISDGLVIEYGSPESIGIVKKYRERLSVKNLSSAEIDVRNAEFKDELELATGSSVRLALNPSVAGLDRGTATRLLQEIPAQWTRVYSERYRIYEAPGLKVSAVTLEFGTLSEPGELIAAIRVLSAIKSGLETMTNDNRISHLVNSSGHSASELRERFHVFVSTRFRPLSSAVLSRPDPVTDSYRSDLQLHVEFLSAQIASFNLIAEQLFKTREGAAAEWAQSTDVSAVNQLQLSGDSLGTIIGLAEKASSAEFLQEVMMDRHALAKEHADTKVRLARLAVADSTLPSEEFVTAVEQNLDVMVREYEELYSISLEKLRTELGTLYSALAGPMRAEEIDLARALTTFVGTVLAALFIGILAAFILPDPAIQKRAT